MKQEVEAGLKGYRYGKGNMQMHYALSAPPGWRAGAALGDVALLHLTPGLDAVSRACNAAAWLIASGANHMCWPADAAGS